MTKPPGEQFWPWYHRITYILALLGLFAIFVFVLLHAFSLLPGPEAGPMTLAVFLEFLLLLMAGVVTFRGPTDTGHTE